MNNVRGTGLKVPGGIYGPKGDFIEAGLIGGKNTAVNMTSKAGFADGNGRNRALSESPTRVARPSRLGCSIIPKRERSGRKEKVKYKICRKRNVANDWSEPPIERGQLTWLVGCSSILH